MTKTKTKTPTRKPRKPIILSSWEWSQYHQQMIKYLEHQLRSGLERREQKIARLERQIARLQGKDRAPAG